MEGSDEGEAEEAGDWELPGRQELETIQTKNKQTVEGLFCEVSL